MKKKIEDALVIVIAAVVLARENNVVVDFLCEGSYILFLGLFLGLVLGVDNFEYWYLMLGMTLLKTFNEFFKIYKK